VRERYRKSLYDAYQRSPEPRYTFGIKLKSRKASQINFFTSSRPALAYEVGWVPGGGTARPEGPAGQGCTFQQYFLAHARWRTIARMKIQGEPAPSTTFYKDKGLWTLPQRERGRGWRVFLKGTGKPCCSLCAPAVGSQRALSWPNEGNHPKGEHREGD
jgi:hypothetical protein